MVRRKHSDDAGSSRRGKRRVKRRHAFGLILLVGLLLLVFFLPKIVTSRSVITTAIDRYAGIAPLTVDFASVQAGWFSPVRASGIKVLDAEGTVIARIGEVQTEKGLLGWITGSSNLGTVHVSQLEAAIVAHDGTTNIEHALKPYFSSIESVPSDDAKDAAAPATLVGTIKVVDSKFLLVETGRPEQWVIAVPRLSATLPGPTQLIGPVQLQATIADVSGTVPNSTGNIVANVGQSDKSKALELQATIENVPIDFWHVIHARLPDVPLKALQGRISGELAGSIASDSDWSFNIDRLDARSLSIEAPELVGDKPAKLQLVSGSARCTLANAVMRLEDAKLTCDFATTSANASIPWPIQIPTASDPFLPGAVISAQGSVDLPRLVAAADSLIPIRENTQLLSGKVEFSIGQQLNTAGQPTSRANLQLSGLKAVADGQQLTWQEPLSIEISADKSGGSPQFAALASAEFVNLQGGGTIESGQLVGDVNLDTLQRRASQWIELPIRTMNGSANVDLRWNLEGENTVVAEGTMVTTPLVLATLTGSELNEPAWQGSFSARIGLDSGIPQRVDRASLLLQSREEKLAIQLQQPLYLIATSAGASKPAAFNVDLHADLEKWDRRATVWFEQPPEVHMGGNLQFAASGLIDLNHVEILGANWKSQPIQVTTPQMSFSEPQMLGKFSGRVDTTDLTRLVVDSLEVQSTSFSIGAQDAAAQDGTSSRVGRAMLQIDLDRLMGNVGSGATAQSVSGHVVPLGSAAEAATDSRISATGIIRGQVAWQVSSEAAGINSEITGESITVNSMGPGQTAPEQIWQEPNVTAAIAGTWIAHTNAVDIPKFQLQMPWMNYQGNLTYSIENAQQTIAVEGQAVYDCAQLSTKLIPYTGGQVQLAGQQTVPVNVTWTGSDDASQSALAGLQATTLLGWDQALVAGIALGKAEVPILITNGQLKTAAEIPVSGGALRWDIDGDLTADELVLVQKPMTVLDNVQITEQMCQGWLKYVAPLVAEATRVDGRLSLRLDKALLTPADPQRQTAEGQLIIHNATIGPGPLSNQVITLAKQVEAIRKRDFAQAVSSTQRVWMDMPEQHIDFQMLDGRVSHRNLTVKVGDANISTAGSVHVGGQVEMLATMPIPDDWAEKSPLLAGLRGQSLQFPVGGTLSSPQVDTQLLQQLGRQTVRNAATGLLQQGINRGIGKLLGGGNAPADPGVGRENPDQQNPLQGIGQQILGGQGLNLPGLFPGLGGQNPPPGNQ